MINISAFDATLRIGEAGIQPSNPDANGVTYDCQMVLGVITVLQVGPGQAAPIPIGMIRIPLDKPSAKSLGEELLKVAETLSERSDLQIATSPQDVEAIARAQQGLK